jgi:chaperonin GroES
MDIETLQVFANADNIAVHLSEDELQKIGRTCHENYKRDKASRADWEKTIEKAIKLAKQVLDERSRPGMDSCSNTNYPLITVAAIQFNARAYPAIISNQLVVKGEPIGQDKEGIKQERATRIGKHMSYQYLHEQEEWETDTDRLTLMLPIMGDMFRKSYYDPNLGRNASKLIMPQNLVYDYDTPFEKVTRKTEVFELYPNEIEERQRAEIYLDIDLNIGSDEIDQEKLQVFLEQHCLLDLDNDGYKEPYIVTFEEKTQKVVRIAPRFDFEEIIIRKAGKTGKIRELGTIDVKTIEVIKIIPVEYYTNYYFIPSADGKGYNLGLGELLENISESINTNLNQLIDAGTLANQQGGFITKGIKTRKGRVRAALNEFVPIQNHSGMSLRENIVPFDFKGPAPTLFQLLGFLVEAARDISSVKDVMTGESAGANESPTVYVSRINEGLKVFSAIYKRIHASLKKEFKKQFRLNRIYLEPQQYFRILDDELAVSKTDYNHIDIDVIPVSDPSMATMTQKMAVAQALIQMFKNDPRVNQAELNNRIFEAMDISGTDRLIIPDEQLQPPPPDPKLIKAQADMMKVQAEVGEIAAKTEKTRAEITTVYSQFQKDMAEIQSNFAKLDIEKFKAFMSVIEKVVTEEENYNIYKKVTGEQGRIPQMEESAGNTGGLPTT